MNCIINILFLMKMNVYEQKYKNDILFIDLNDIIIVSNFIIINEFYQYEDQQI